MVSGPHETGWRTRDEEKKHFCGVILQGHFRANPEFVSTRCVSGCPLSKNLHCPLDDINRLTIIHQSGVDGEVVIDRVVDINPIKIP